VDSAGKSTVKKRNQFRIHSKHLDVLYEAFAPVDVDGA